MARTETNLSMAGAPSKGSSTKTERITACDSQALYVPLAFCPHLHDQGGKQGGGGGAGSIAGKNWGSEDGRVNHAIPMGTVCLAGMGLLIL